jgi:hypothetical protein
MGQIHVYGHGICRPITIPVSVPITDAICDPICVRIRIPVPIPIPVSVARVRFAVLDPAQEIVTAGVLARGGTVNYKVMDLSGAGLGGARDFRRTRRMVPPGPSAVQATPGLVRNPKPNPP